MFLKLTRTFNGYTTVCSPTLCVLSNTKLFNVSYGRHLLQMACIAESHQHHHFVNFLSLKNVNEKIAIFTVHIGPEAL